MSEMNNGILADAHKKGLRKARSAMPEMDASKIVRYVVGYFSGEKELNDIAKELSQEYAPAVKKYLETFSDQLIKDALKQTDNEELQKLAKGDFSKRIRQTTINISKNVEKYMKGEMDEVELVQSITESGIVKIGQDIIRAYGVDLSDLIDKDGHLIAYSAETVAFICMTKIYDVLMKALDDAAIAYERRLQIEAEVAKSLELIRKYRSELKEKTEKYFTKHYETIEVGMKAMDEAIIEGDSDGFIRGNTEIQKMLGYKVQFNNQKEFDELMDSEMELKL